MAGRAGIVPHEKGVNRSGSAYGWLHLARTLVVDKMYLHYVPLNDGDHAETFRYSLMMVVIVSWRLPAWKTLRKVNERRKSNFGDVVAGL